MLGFVPANRRGLSATYAESASRMMSERRTLWLLAKWSSNGQSGEADDANDLDESDPTPGPRE